MLHTTVSKQRLTHQQRRQAIIDSAKKVFAERGFRGTTTKELAAAAGVTEPVLYMHFHAKRDLYTAIIDEKSCEGSEKLAGELGPFRNGRDDRGFFTRLGELILDWHEQDPAYIRLLLFSGLERHELADIFHERQSKAFFETVMDYIDLRIKEGVFRQVDPMLAARAVVGMLSMEGQSRAIFGHGLTHLDRERLVAEMVDIFLSGIQRRA